MTNGLQGMMFNNVIGKKYTLTSCKTSIDILMSGGKMGYLIELLTPLHSSSFENVVIDVTVLSGIGAV